MSESGAKLYGLTRGQLRRTGVNAETIRYFERVGILASPPRTAGGHRIYSKSHVRTLEFVNRARGLGFTPEEVRAIMDLGGPGKARCSKVRELAARHLAQVRSKITDLLEIERLLAHTIKQCSGGADADCPVMDMIEDAEVENMG